MYFERGAVIITEQLTLPGGTVIEYEIKRKQVKNMNVRVNPDYKCHISAPEKLSYEYIINFLMNNEEFLLKSLEKQKSRSALYESDEHTLIWLGSTYPVRAVVSPLEYAEFNDDELVIYTKTLDPEHIITIRNKWIDASFAEYVREDLNKEVLRGLKENGFERESAVINFRNMKTRWGSCTYKRNRITLNTKLAAYPKGTVLSVIWHEYAHFWCPRHNLKFYRFLSKLYPEYDKWNSMLK